MVAVGAGLGPAMLPMAVSAEPITITVTTTDDILDPSDGVVSLREAAAEASAAGADQVITVVLAESATYALSCPGGVPSAGTLAITGAAPVAIDGRGATVTTACASAILAATGVDAAAELSLHDLTLQSTAAIGTHLVTDRVTDLVDVDVSGPSRFAITQSSSNRSLHLLRTTVHGTGGIETSGSVEVDRSTIEGTSSTPVQDGAIVAPRLTIRDSVIRDNRHDVGGVVANALVIERTRIEDNTGRAYGGVTSFATLTITDSTIIGNRSDTGVGGVRALGGDSGEATIRNTTIADNRGTAGGLAVETVLDLATSTVSGNVGTDVGGVAVLGTGHGSITDTTIVENRGGPPNAPDAAPGATLDPAREGAPVPSPRAAQLLAARTSIPRPLTVARTILGAGQAGIGPAPGIAACAFDEIPVAVAVTTSYSVDATCPVPAGSGNIVAAGDPGLLPLADNGGPAPTHRPLGWGAVADRIPFADRPPRDQDGAVRHDFGAVGAVEPGPTATVGRRYHPVPADRIYDSREGDGPLAAGEERVIAVEGRGGVPFARTAAVTVNVTATDTTGASHLTVWRTGEPMPPTSHLNWVAGQTVANAVTVRTGVDGTVTIRNNGGDADVIVDVSGWYDRTTTPGGLGMTPAPPLRILDTRAGSPVPAGGMVTATVSGRPGVAADATVAIVTLTGVTPTTRTHLGVGPDGGDGSTSTLNLDAGEVAAALVYVPLAPDGTFGVRNNSGDTHVLVDLLGTFSPTGALSFHDSDPRRLADSRTTWPAGPFTGPVAPFGPGESRFITVAQPELAFADLVFVGNATAIRPTEDTHLTAAAEDAVVDVSSVNVASGAVRAGATLAALGPVVMVQGPEVLVPARRMAIRNNSGSVDVVVDSQGWFGLVSGG